MPGYSVHIWLALAAPKETPKSVLAQLNTALQHALEEKEVVDALADVGIEAWPTTATDATDFVDAEGKRWPAVMTRGQARPE